MIWDAISYHGRSNLLRFEGNLNSSRYVREVLQSEVIPFLQDSPGATFQQDNARPHVAKTVRDFYSTQTCNFFLGLFIPRICSLLSTCGIWLVCRSWSASYSFERRTLAGHTSNMKLSSTSRHLKTVWLQAMFCSSTCCSAWWLHQILISNTFFFLLWKFLHLFVPIPSRLFIKFHLILMIPSWWCIFYKY